MVAIALNLASPRAVVVRAGDSRRLLHGNPKTCPKRRVYVKENKAKGTEGSYTTHCLRKIDKFQVDIAKNI